MSEIIGFPVHILRRRWKSHNVRGMFNTPVSYNPKYFWIYKNVKIIFAIVFPLLILIYVVRYSLPFETFRGAIDQLADTRSLGFNTELLVSQHKIR